MTEKPFESEDPFVGVNWIIPHVTSPEACLLMAQTFIEEYMRMGWTEEAILDLFRDPFYRGPHGLLLAFGEGTIRGLIQGLSAQFQSQGTSTVPSQPAGLPKRRAFCG